MASSEKERVQTSVLDENQDTQIPEDSNALVLWIKAHKAQLLFVGISVPAIIATALGLKNKDAIKAMWKTLCEAIEEANKFTPDWLKNASYETLKSEHEKTWQNLCAAGKDNALIHQLECRLRMLNQEMNMRDWAGEIPHSTSVHREHAGIWKPDY